MITWGKDGLKYRAEGAEGKVYEIELDRGLDRYILKVDGVKVEGKDKDGSWYYLDEAKTYCLSQEPEGVVDVKVRPTWIANEEKGYNLEGSDLRIILDKESDRYQIWKGKKTPVEVGIYHMRVAKRTVLELAAKEKVAEGVK